MSKIKKSTRILLIVALVLVICGSFLANLFNTSVYSVRVSRINFDTANGNLSGLLYMPKTASASSPRPAIIVTHGYLNSAEMQDANAIELSRRGYVVLALDMYDHGHSNINESVYEPYAPYGDFLMTWAPFWINSMNDAVQYMYDQPYVLKDDAGNGVIGVTGHSMGGFSSTMAVFYDEQAYAQSGIRKIMANLTEGSDFSYSGIFGCTAEVFDQSAGGRTLGKVAAQYDEFFFNAPDDPDGTVRKKDYVSTPDGKTFLQQENGAANTWYDTADGGKRIIYEPLQTHPWNHFSKVTTASAVEFYTEAFKDYNTDIKDIASDNQNWQWKETFECVALLGFIFFILSIALIVIELPFFNKAKTATLTPQPGQKDTKMKVITCLILVVAILLPGIFFVGMYDGEATNKNILFWCELAVTLGALVLAVLGFMRKKQKRFLVGGCFALIAGVGLAAMLKSTLYSGKYWVAPVINSVGYWTLGCALISMLVMSTMYVAFKANDGLTLANYGVVFNPLAIIASLCAALVTVVAGYILLFLVDLIFKTDFRIWTFAFKTFDMNIIPAILKYLPTFLMFYIISTAAITINTNSEKLQGVNGYVLAILLNAGGITLWLIRQYLTLFTTGVAAHPTAALSGIVLVAMVPTLAIAACISRALYKRTGNIWMPAFLNGLLMTIMAVANTTVYFK